MPMADPRHKTGRVTVRDRHNREVVMATWRSRLYLALLVGPLCLHFLRRRSWRNDGRRPPRDREVVTTTWRSRLYLALLARSTPGRARAQSCRTPAERGTNT